MRVSADLGCLQDARRLTNHPFHAATTVRWEENYVCSKIAMELPSEGTQKIEMQCPVCGGGMLLKLASIERFRLLLICVVDFIAFVIFGVGLLLTCCTGGDPVLRMAGLIAFGLGVLVFCGALTLNFLKAEWLAWSNDILDISRDNVREQEMAPGFSGMRGHKLFNIRGVAPLFCHCPAAGNLPRYGPLWHATRTTRPAVTLSLEGTPAHGWLKRCFAGC